MTRQVGNEIDEFVTEALRNNLLGLPLDLAAINIARGRDTGMPSLNAARREFYDMTGDSQLKPYTSWADFAQHLKHPESLINFIAAYGTHTAITGADHAGRQARRGDRARLAACRINAAADQRRSCRLRPPRLPEQHGRPRRSLAQAASPRTGLDDVDLWIGGLAEKQMPFGGMLGSTFNFVFETQLENLQNGDRFYYLSRTAGLNFLTELENNSFAKLVMANTDATHLPADDLLDADLILEVDPTQAVHRPRR